MTTTSFSSPSSLLSAFVLSIFVELLPGFLDLPVRVSFAFASAFAAFAFLSVSMSALLSIDGSASLSARNFSMMLMTIAASSPGYLLNSAFFCSSFRGPKSSLRSSTPLTYGSSSTCNSLEIASASRCSDPDRCNTENVNPWRSVVIRDIRPCISPPILVIMYTSA